MKESARVGELLLALRAAVFVWIDGAHKAMTCCVRIVLDDQLQADLQRSGLAPQPRKHSPNGHVVETAFVDL